MSLVDSFPEPDVKVRALENVACGGGSSLNAAITFAHLGGEAHLASALGPDHLYRSMIAAELDQFGVRHEEICNDPAFEIPVSTVISTRSTSSRLIVNSSAEECRNVRFRPELFDADFAVIQLDQYERHFVEQHAAQIKAFDGPIVLDGGGWKDWSMDFLRLVGLPIVSERFFEDGPKAFGELCAGLGIQRWAMTLGERGLCYGDRGKTGTIAAPRVKAVDTLGAGDIFHGAFCFFYLQQEDFIDALTRATEVAARSCTAMGTRAWMSA